MTNKKSAGAWDDPENEAQNNFFKWGKVGNYIFGTLISKKQVPSTLEGKENTLQWIYEVKVKEGAYNDMDEDKKALEPTIELSADDIINVGGRAMYDSRMARVKVGQIFGLKFTETLKATKKGRSDTKLIKTFTPRGDDGEFLMDKEFLMEREAADFGNDEK